MARRNVARGLAKPVNKLLSAIVWIAGVLVALAVGFGLINTVLVIPAVPEILTIFAGWVVVVLTIIGVIMAIAEALK